MLRDASRLIAVAEDDTTAVVFDGGHTLRYADLRAAAARWRDPIEAGTRRLIAMLPDASPEAVLDLVGALAAGHAVMLLPPDRGDLLTAVRARFGPHRVLRREGSRWLHESCHDEPIDLDPQLGLLLSTSGSTGEPKFVRLSYRNVVSNALSIGEYLGLDADERGMLNLPLHYSFGLSVLTSHLAAGARVLVSDRSVTEEALWQFAEAEGATSFAGVPHSYELLAASGFLSRRLPALRTLTQAGGRLALPTARRFAEWSRERGARLFVMYGQTEASPRMAYVPPELVADHADCIGRAIPGGTLRVVDDDGRPIKRRGVEGELEYQGPNVMMGYALQRDDLAQPAGPDVLRTGDLAVIDERSGLFRITGRRSRFLKPFGLRISLDQVERRLEAEGVRAACGGSDEFLGVLASRRGSLPDDLRERVAGWCGLPPDAVWIDVVDALPVLASGKTDLRRVGEMLREGFGRSRASALESAGSGFGPAAAGGPRERVLAAFEATFPEREVAAFDTFESLGGNSLRYVQISVRLAKLIAGLPRRWDRLSISELQDLAEQRALAAHAGGGGTLSLEVTVVFRALACLLVVMDHAGLSFLAGGAALLLAVVGMNFARFQLGALLDGRVGSVVSGLAWNVLLPFWAFALAYGLLRGGVNWPDLLLVGNFYELDSTGNSGFETWFVHVMAQSIALVIALLMLPGVRAGVRSRPFGATLLFLALAVATRVSEPLLAPGLEINGGRELPWQLWIFVLGMLIHAAHTAPQKLAASALSVLLPLTLYWGDPSRVVILALGCLLMTWRSMIPVPRALVPAIAGIGAASLYIYMLHPRAPVDSITAHWPVDLLRIATGVIIGLLAWKLFTASTQRLRGWMHRSKRLRPLAR